MPSATRTGVAVRRRLAAGIAGLGAVALAVLGLPAQAHAASPATTSQATSTAASPATSTSGPSASTPSANVGNAAFQPSCGAPAKGAFACYALHRTGLKARKGVQAEAATPGGYGPSDLTSAYNLPSDGGAGQTIAIVDAFDDPDAEADLGVYRAQYGLPACTTANGCFTKVDQRGGSDYPAPNTGWAGEISLDVDMVSAVAPNAKILLVEADTADDLNLALSVDTAVELGAKFVSNSYGDAYDSQAGSGEHATDTTEIDVHYNHPGVAVVASSGDSAYGVTYPAASPYVTSVGGTSLVRDSTSPRGWSESVWNDAEGGAGSGCSVYEPKPAFQNDTGCDNRAVADVSAVADPETGVAVYQTYGASGWGQFGGTSAASPIITGVYADAGTPAAGTYPNSYPYMAGGAGINDVTSGDNGVCAPDYLCTAEKGYDGPTGLGTPDGLAAFRSGPHGDVRGTVTDAATGKPLAGAQVAVGDFTTTTAADGSYDVTVVAGSHDVAVKAFGYATSGGQDVAVDDGATVTRDYALKSVPSHTVSGKVTDGSGHGWPLYAKITVKGSPLSVFTNPVTGAYTVKLPENSDYTLHFTTAYSGYRAVQKTISVGLSDQKLNVSVPVDPYAASTPGYRIKDDAPVETFDAAPATPDGWSVSTTSYSDVGWKFDDPNGRGNHTGGSGGFAIVDMPSTGGYSFTDSTLSTPSYDLTGVSSPEIDFDTDFVVTSGLVSLDASTDGGKNWKTVWYTVSTLDADSHVSIPLPDYAGKASVKLRFDSVNISADDLYWEVDDVQVGELVPQAVPGGLIIGAVKDGNDGSGVDGAAVTASGSSAKTVSIATPGDPAVGNGLYSLFSPSTGAHKVTAAKGGYTSASATAHVTADSVVRQDYTLKAGRITVGPGSVDASSTLGGTTSRKVTVTNTGSAPATVQLTEQSGDFSAAGTGAPLQETKVDASPAVADSAQAAKDGKGTPQPTTTASTGTAWQSGPDAPTTIMDNAVAENDGTIYSAFGWNGKTDTADMWALDPASGTWTKKASAADTRETPAYGFIDGRLYVVGGWGPIGPDAKLEIYDPATDSWSTGASSPEAYYSSGSGVVDGKLYVVGGCGGGTCDITDVQVYDPTTDSWTAAARYPEPVASPSCAAINGKLYCAGGDNDEGEVAHSYVYDPKKNTWTAIADLPAPMWGAAGSAANGQLLLSTGVSGGAITNRGYAYDPKTDAWSSLPNANTATYGAAAAPGLYKIGGGTSITTPTSSVELLPGYDQPSDTGADWLRESAGKLTLRPGEHATVTLSMSASPTTGTPQPGTYRAELLVSTSTPYHVPSVPVTLTVKPSKHRGSTTHGAGPASGSRSGLHQGDGGTARRPAQDEVLG
ncbi:Kelch repeat-containing protein [Actinacidiphila yeochonensis]|uniref:Kelch repeat-containing protein n=1 Tax=Actinacidiphila yeochonensis TaxID=89050 RepID=UPI00068B15E3|nr:kelch repeat-containing protein [Actinacidiphila yeochonensis]